MWRNICVSRTRLRAVCSGAAVWIFPCGHTVSGRSIFSSALPVRKNVRKGCPCGLRERKYKRKSRKTGGREWFGIHA